MISKANLTEYIILVLTNYQKKHNRFRLQLFRDFSYFLNSKKILKSQTTTVLLLQKKKKKHRKPCQTPD